MYSHSFAVQTQGSTFNLEVNLGYRCISRKSAFRRLTIVYWRKMNTRGPPLPKRDPSSIATKHSPSASLNEITTVSVVTGNFAEMISIIFIFVRPKLSTPHDDHICVSVQSLCTVTGPLSFVSM